MRSLVLVCLLGGIASADPALPVDVVTKGKQGDWSAFDAEHLEAGQLVKERVVAVAMTGELPGDYRVFWFRGQTDGEVLWRSDVFATPDTRLIGIIAPLTAKDLKSASATCKLDTSFACTKVTYVGDATETGKTLAVTALMAPRIKGTGIVELEVKEGSTVVWKWKVVGYGTDGHAAAKSEWGVAPSKNKLHLAIATEIGRIRSSGFGISSSRLAAQPGAGMSSIEAKGDLDKAIIRRYLRRNIAKLTYCYEKELAAKPKLRGKVDFTFVIEPDGKVSASTAKGLAATVESCTAGVLKQIEYPKPKNGSKVDVAFSITYELPKPR